MCNQFYLNKSTILLDILKFFVPACSARLPVSFWAMQVSFCNLEPTGKLFLALPNAKIPMPGTPLAGAQEQ